MLPVLCDYHKAAGPKQGECIMFSIIKWIALQRSPKAKDPDFKRRYSSALK
jgi:hypothetical protein